MFRRAFPWALFALALCYPAFLLAVAAAPEAALAAAWAGERWAYAAPGLLASMGVALYFLSPGFGERAREAGRSFKAQLTLNRHEISELEDGEARMQNHFYAQKLGEACLRRFMFREAEEAFRRAAPRDPSSPSTFYLWGQCLLRLGRPADAVTVLGHARDLDPGHDLGQVLLVLAEALLRAGQIPEGVDRAREFLERSGSHPKGHYLLALLLEKSADLDGARAEMEKSAALVRSAPAYNRREHRFLAQRARRWLARRGL